MTTPDLNLQLREIWQAGVNAVLPRQLLPSVVQVTSGQLHLAGHHFNLSDLGRIIVVGGGKAGAGMAAALEHQLGPQLLHDRVTGWVNVPADCLQPLQKIHLHPARPAGVNEPTAEGVLGTQKILDLVSQAQPRDLCVVLLSGGGSALLPAPVPEISLADKQALTRFLMHAGADIRQLNTVRTQLSLIKGGGLARACQAHALVALIISDVVGDPLDIIASGPTVPHVGTPREALDILLQYRFSSPQVPVSIVRYLEEKSSQPQTEPPPTCEVFNHIIANNKTALSAAAGCATTLGYSVQSLGSENQGTADDTGRSLARQALRIQPRLSPGDPPVCLLSGGEPTVTLTLTTLPRKGGRNQQLILAALDELWHSGLKNLAFLSGGTDGEDGPTDAAGAILDQDLWLRAQHLNKPPRADLEIQNAYNYFDPLEALLKPGPTHTNVMDLRVALIHPLAG